MPTNYPVALDDSTTLPTVVSGGVISGGTHTFTEGRKHGEGRNGRSIRDLIQKVDC